MQIYKEKANLLREVMRDDKAKLYAVINHPLASHEEYYRDLYLKMLCLIAHYSDGMNESQLFMLQRLILGVTGDTSVQEYIRRASEADEEFLNDFIDGFRTEELRFSFVVDSLVLSAIGSKDNTDQLQFIAELSEQLQINTEEIKYLALLSQSIIEQNHDKYTAAEETRPSRISFESFFYFTKSFVQVFIATGNDQFFMAFHERTRYNFDQQVGADFGTTSMLMRQRHIHMENMIIDTEAFQLTFEGCERVVLNNCELIGSTNSLIFKCCKEIRLEKCLFRDFSGRALIFEDVTDIRIDSCDFNKCLYIHSKSWGDWDHLGGVIYSQEPANIQSLNIDHCSFKECGGSNARNYYASAIISNCICKVTHSKFVNCWSYYYNNQRDPEDARRTLFPASSINQNNEVIASANFS